MHEFPRLVGASKQFRAALNLMQRFAHCDACVLLLGETGTGKELAARAIHYHSLRRDRPFVPVNCGALPDTLIESELFGHARGAFTDAREASKGLVAQAHGGTLFLDEIDSLSTRGQVCLLRLLQDSTYRPLGSPLEQEANVRVIAAASPGLHRLVEEGSFRPDLAFRLNILSISIPPLRERPGDATLITEHVLAQLAIRYQMPAKRLDAESLAWIERYGWPGNVREVENLLHREFLLAEGDVIALPQAQLASDRRKLSDRRRPDISLTDFRRAKADAIRRFEMAYLTELMAQCHGNVTRAANVAGRDRRVLGRMLKKYSISRQSFC